MKKSNNPKYDFRLPEAWVIAGQCHSKKLYWDDIDRIAKAQYPDEPKAVHEAHNLMARVQWNSDKFTARVARRLPVRAKIPFFLRPKYAERELMFNKTQVMPDINYKAAAAKPKPYQPIINMKEKLHMQRHAKMRRVLEGVIRWPYDISSNASTYTVCKSFEQFSLKVNTGKTPNVLPKEHMPLELHITAPLEFFNMDFYGFDENHLVIRELERYSEDDMTVVRTESCDRMDLYTLGAPNVLKERWYISSSSGRGTGLTLDAAIRSMEYYQAKKMSGVLTHGLPQ